MKQVTNNISKFATIAIAFAVVILLNTGTCFASEDASSFISGTVWMDHNGNQIQELMEETLPNATVYIENLETGEIVTAETDMTGTFVISNLAFGRYVVWAEGETAYTDTQVVELNEVQGSMMLSFAASAAESDVEMTAIESVDTTPEQTNFIVFLPVVNN
ncbi:MAG: carboxypeptidase-like regulatory domain-containing protein [Chloroflexota bacterium]